jgi:hypothetical protein
LLRKRVIIESVFDQLKNMRADWAHPTSLVLELFGERGGRFDRLHMAREEAVVKLQL